MELRHLRYLLAVADGLSFRRAADRLRIAQPGLSKQIRDLEAELGVRLLDRGALGVRLTDAGRVFVEKARAILRDAEEAAELARGAAAGRRGRLTIGNVGALSTSFLPASLARFRARFPDVDVTLIDMTPPEQIAALETGAIQIGLAIGHNLRLPDFLTRTVIRRAPICAYFGRGHRLARAPRVALADLAKENLLCLTDQKQSRRHADMIRDLFVARRLAPEHLRPVEGFESLLTLLASNTGISLMPRMTSLARMDGVAIKPLRDTGRDIVVELWAIWRNHGASRLAGNFVSVLQSAGAKTA